MAYCPNCGSAVEMGRVCLCQQQQQYRQPYQQPPQQPYQQSYQQQYPQPYPQPYQQVPYPYGVVVPPLVRQKRPGETMIMVSGILMTILSGLGLVMALIILPLAAGSIGSGDEEMTNFLIYELISIILTLAFGIAGISISSKKASAPAVIGFGMALITLRILFLVWVNNVTYDMPPAIVVYCVLGCLLPLLYIVGGSIRARAGQ